jgi:hypothetical protein
MKTLYLRRRRRSGSVLLVVLLAIVLVGTLLSSYLGRVMTEQRLTTKSLLWNQAIPVVDAGIEEALAHLNKNVLTNELNPDRIPNPTADDWRQVTSQVFEMSRTVDSWSKNLTNDHYSVRVQLTRPWQPEIYAVGYVQVPFAARPIFAAINWTDFPQRDGYTKRRVKAVAVLDPLFPKGLVAEGQIDLRGNNIVVDSFDSRSETFSTEGQYDPAKAKDGGDVATNGALTNSLSIGNATIHGHVATGPGGNVHIGPNGGVGTRDWLAGHDGMQPGYFTDDMNVDFPDANAPTAALLIPQRGSITNTNGIVTAYDVIIPPGIWRMSQLTGKVYVDGNAKVLVTTTLRITGNDVITIGPNSSLDLYVGASSATLAGNGVVNESGLAKNFSYYGLPSNTSIILQGNGEFIGTIYAPNAEINFGGGGNSIMDFVGACVAKTATLSGHYNFHFDEALKEEGPPRAYVVDFWREQ